MTPRFQLSTSPPPLTSPSLSISLTPRYRKSLFSKTHHIRIRTPSFPSEFRSLRNPPFNLHHILGSSSHIPFQIASTNSLIYAHFLSPSVTPTFRSTNHVCRPKLSALLP